MTDLLVSGGTVVTAERSFAADVAIRDGRIAEVAPGLARRHPGAETIDARGLLVLPGCVDVHTHTRVPSEDEPDRFYQDSVAAAVAQAVDCRKWRRFNIVSLPGGCCSLPASRDIRILENKEIRNKNRAIAGSVPYPSAQGGRQAPARWPGAQARRSGRQQHVHRGAGAGTADDFQPAAMQFHQTAAD